MKTSYISVCDTFPRVDVEMCSACKCDYLQRGNNYNFLHLNSKLCGRNSYNYLEGYISNVYWRPEFTDGSTGYLRFVSDDTAHYTGFKLTFIAKSSSGG